MTERADSQFQPNALFTCTGKIAGLLDHQVMTHAPAFEQDYIFIVVPDTWTFHDRAMSNQASATQLLPTTPKGTVGNPSDYSDALARFTSTRKRKAAPNGASPTPPASSSIDPHILTSRRSLPHPDQTPTKRPRLSPETSTIVTACDSQGSAKSDTSSVLSHEDAGDSETDTEPVNHPRHIHLWLYQTSRVDLFPTAPPSTRKRSESFAQIGKALMPRVKDHNPLISFTSKLLNQLVAERDYSKQEVSHLLLGLPLQEGSRTCLYVDSRNPDRHSRSLRIDGDEVDEAPNVYEKYCQRLEALADQSYVSFLECWNFRPRDPSKWKKWQPGNV
ncbi:hypothetical protein HIM_09844 [Hirsutella minnesotensis 3608]|uniref:Uncharacterized protein n=1 Tax=Hirsutella minnesotensis 3608 TaxID=1043627 RepID=A0A0F7ZKU3_9HYPO|nr:hypothetical protein HIM_09844 [Hirsutella minnesotensis 3608]